MIVYNLVYSQEIESSNLWCELPRYVARQLSVYGQSKILLLHDVDALGLDSLSPQQVACDVACLVYDATDEHSFEHVARLYLKVRFKEFYFNNCLKIHQCFSVFCRDVDSSHDVGLEVGIGTCSPTIFTAARDFLSQTSVTTPSWLQRKSRTSSK